MPPLTFVSGRSPIPPLNPTRTRSLNLWFDKTHQPQKRQTRQEPSKEELIATLLPKVVRLRVFTTLLDSTAAEHAARTVAMQLATDNGNDLLRELTLEYNKGRQQKITSEILDIVGGSLQ